MQDEPADPADPTLLDAEEIDSQEVFRRRRLELVPSRATVFGPKEQALVADYPAVLGIHEVDIPEPAVLTGRGVELVAVLPFPGKPAVPCMKDSGSFPTPCPAGDGPAVGGIREACRLHAVPTPNGFLSVVPAPRLSSVDGSEDDRSDPHASATDNEAVLGVDKDDVVQEEKPEIERNCCSVPGVAPVDGMEDVVVETQGLIRGHGPRGHGDNPALLLVEEAHGTEA